MPDFASATKVGLEPGEINALVRNAFGARAQVSHSRTAQGGMYNAGYRLDLADGLRVFLKVAPPAAMPALTYEQNLMTAEASVLAHLANAKLGHAPALLSSDFSHRLVDRDYLFMAHLDGDSFADAQFSPETRLSVRHEIGRIAGSVCSITANVFGYPAQPQLQASTWPEAFTRMWHALVDDAKRFDIAWPLPADEVASAFVRARETLVPIDQPRLVHFDLWDGNVLVQPDGTITGIIDWERAFFGDPLAEIVSLCLFDNDDERTALFEGLAEGSGNVLTFDDATRRRLALYRAYLWLIMIVEAKPRRFGGSILLPASRAAKRFGRDLLFAAGP